MKLIDLGLKERITPGDPHIDMLYENPKVWFAKLVLSDSTELEIAEEEDGQLSIRSIDCRMVIHPVAENRVLIRRGGTWKRI